MAQPRESDERLYKRGVRFVPQGIGGYDENWYPICLSSEVKRGRIGGFKFLNGKVIIVRNPAGELTALSAYCRHLGVDLSLGTLVGGLVRCPYHHWQYDASGQCVKTAVGDTPPSRAKLFDFPVRERLGLVWIYNGEEPAYEVPHFSVEESELEFMVCRGVELPMDPFMLFSNTMDLQHLISLHGARFDTMPEQFDIQERTISYSQEMEMPKIGYSVQTVKLWGTNCITLESEIKGRPSFMMSPGLCIKGPITRTFNVSATLRSDSRLRGAKATTDLREKLKTKMHVRLLDAFGRKLNADDDPIFRGISPRLDNLSASDKALSIYFDYARSYPRSNVAEDLICNDYRAAAPR
jgi:phenylpropionate dioxygenase-like ring-hydroxylating dioxygenase large terminal subunit